MTISTYKSAILPSERLNLFDQSDELAATTSVLVVHVHAKRINHGTDHDLPEPNPSTLILHRSSHRASRELVKDKLQSSMDIDQISRDDMILNASPSKQITKRLITPRPFREVFWHQSRSIIN
jgi:hypothetical protein